MGPLLVVVIAACALAAGGTPTEPQQVKEIDEQIGQSHYRVHFEDTVTAFDDDVSALGRSLNRDSFFESYIRSLLESAQPTLESNDPLLIDQVGPASLGNIGYTGSITGKDININGFSDYKVNDVSFNILRLALTTDITVPRITTTGAYETRVRVLLFTYTSGGRVRFILNNLTADVYARLGTSLLGGRLFLRELDLNLNVQSSSLRVYGLTGSTIVNLTVNGIIAGFTNDVVQSALDNVADSISETVFEVVNDILADYTLADILG